MTSQPAREVLDQLRSMADPEHAIQMARFGIQLDRRLGIPMPKLRELARSHKRDHPLALRLWASGYHEARILAALVDDPQLVSEQQMEEWVSEFDSWDVCDQVCGGLFDKTSFAQKKVKEWSARPEEYVKRAAYVLMASLAVHDKSISEGVFERWLPLIARAATDERNFVRKAVNWALRQIGKRNSHLYIKSLKLAQTLSQSESKSARWIGKDEARELENKRTLILNRK